MASQAFSGQESVINPANDSGGPISAAQPGSHAAAVILEWHNWGVESISGWRMCGLKLFSVKCKKIHWVSLGDFSLWGLNLRVSDASVVNLVRDSKNAE